MAVNREKIPFCAQDLKPGN